MSDLYFKSDCKCIFPINTDFDISLADAFHKLQQLKQLSGTQIIQGVEKTMSFVSTVYHSNFSNKYKRQKFVFSNTSGSFESTCSAEHGHDVQDPIKNSD